MFCGVLPRVVAIAATAPDVLRPKFFDGLRFGFSAGAERSANQEGDPGTGQI